MKKNKIIIYIMLAVILVVIVMLVASPSLGFSKSGSDSEESTETPVARLTFDADSAYVYCSQQCDFGPRTMNSEAHEKCAEWIKGKFEEFGCTVESQQADLKGYDKTVLKSTNIIARLNPGAKNRILLCAHWDSRPWADNDPDESNHKLPVMAANDGASGVAVMLELARILNADSASNSTGIDFVCFDAEDWGTPQWAESGSDDSDTWALGAQYWAKNFHKNRKSNDFQYEYAILVDMVGGEGAKFYQEGMSRKFASSVVDMVWQAANEAGYGSFFPYETGGYITDDHIPVNEKAHIPCIDIIAYYPDCPQSSFGPTWHTVSDTMDHISKSTLKAVGQTLAYLLGGKE